MKTKIVYVFFIIFSLIFVLAGCNNEDNNTFQSNVTYNKTNTDVSINNISNENSVTNNSINNVVNEIHLEHNNVEEEMATFSTKLGGKDTPRSRNIKLTTGILNETVINNGETFSFNDLIGNPTADRGYEEADSFNAEGETVKTFGGGNCQVSTTLYNVVLQISDLEVKERHEHIKPVHYVEKGKDATVAYGSVDFKFKNNTR